MTKTTYKVGDKVRILDAKNIQNAVRDGFKTGGIYNVKRINGSGRPVIEHESDFLAFWPDELQYIEKVEESDAKMTQFKVGDKVRIISTDAALCGFSIGDKVEITKSKHDGSKTLGRHTFEVDGRGFCDAEHIELVSPKPTKNQRLTSAEQAISSLEQKVEAMQAEIDALKATQQAPKITAQSDATKIAEEIAARLKVRTKLTPNEQRKAIIDEAKAFVEDVTKRMSQYGHGNKLGVHGEITTNVRGYVTKVEFVVNADKRTVVAIVRNLYGDYIREKAITKCAPGDVFNADIGKAIALGRALGLDVERFEKAVQPTEFAVGQVTKDTSLDAGKVTRIEGDKAFTERYTYWYAEALTRGKAFIIDDTEAQY